VLRETLGDPRGKEKRCHGFTSDDGKYAHCSREELAGGIDQENGGTYAHRLHGPCNCGQTHGEDNRPDEIEAVYRYTDEKGAVLFEVVRKTGKRFLQRVPIGGGEYEWKLNGARRVIYRLHDVALDDGDRPVYVAEGEKDVDALWKRGHVATCNPMGAGKWAAVADVARAALQGRDVIVIADGDGPGRAHARDVEASLRDVARSIKVVECARGKDVSDHFAGGGTLEELVPLKDEEARNDDDGPVEKPTPVILYGADLAEPLPPVDWLCPGLRLTSGAPTNAAGNAYSGKSLAWEDVKLAVATGGSAWGMYACKRARAMSLDYDGQGRRVSQDRVQRLARARGVDLREIDKAIAYVRRPGFYLDDHDADERLCKLLDGFALCVIDSWRGATPNTDEWRRGPVQLVGDRLESVSTRTGCAIVMIDHNVKPPRDGKSNRSAMHDVHGTTAKAELAQSHFAFEGQEGEQLTYVQHVKERVTGQTISPFALRFEDVERDGDPRWGLRVVYVDREELGKANASDAFKQTIEAVRRGLRGHPGAAGADALARLLGIRAGDVRAAVKQLEADGEAVTVKVGKGNGRRIYHVADVPTEAA
jgi:hypothetical protein